MTAVIGSPPHTAVEPVTDVFHGVEVTDPYRWLENQNTERTRQWIKEQTDYARSYLDAIPGRKCVRQRVVELLTVETVDAPYKVGNRYFFLKREPQREQPVICMREGFDGQDQVVLDPTRLGGGVHLSVRIISISPDAKLLAYGLRQCGEDSSTIEILNVETRETLADGLPHGFLSGFAFGADSKSYCYAQEVIGSIRPNYRATYHHVIGTDPKVDREIFFAGESPRTRLGMQFSGDRRYVGYLVLRSETNLKIDFYVQDLFGSSPARLVAEGMEDPFYPFFMDKSLMVLTSWQAPNRRIIEIDLEVPDKSSWRDVVAETALPIKDFTVRGDKLFVSYFENASTRTDIYDRLGHRVGSISYPGPGTTRLLPNPADSDELFYAFSSFVIPDTVVSYQVDKGEQRVWSQKSIAFDASEIDVTQVWYRSKDGTRVPMFLAGKKGLTRTADLPTILTAYGGFGKSLAPQFSVFATFLIERGCLFAVANIRGGAELGQHWHLCARRHKRQNSIDDFISAAEWLIQSGYTTSERLAIVGGSNGGLLVSAAMTQRPEIFRAVVSLGPLTDMLRYHHFDFADLWVDEYGSPENREDFSHLFAYSPYQHVIEGIDYPAVLLVSGDADTRCNPLHARKMTARLQAATASDRPILLGYSPFRGHMPVLPLSDRIEALTERLAFICDQLHIRL